jgi:hypothetical protein
MSPESDVHAQEMQESAPTVAASSNKKSLIILNADIVREIFSFKEHFGAANFIKIFRVFYLLSNIPDEAENNPFVLYMDENSVVRGF